MAGFAVAMLAIPIAIVVKLIVKPFEKPTDRTADEVLRLLRDFQNGAGDDYDWEDFVNVSIADPRLESIRERALALNLPEDAMGFSELKLLLEEAEAVVQAENVIAVNDS